MTIVRVLLVDDHELVRTGLRSLIDNTPDLRVVGEASDGREALARVRELRPDVVVTDLSMPGMDGAAAAERILQEYPGVRVIALTAHDDRGHLTRLLSAGARGYLLKRAAAEELVRAIRTVAAGSVYVDPVLAGGMLQRSAQPFRAGHDAASDLLSDREEEVLRRVAWGETNKEIAGHLGISTKTVETYRARISEKLGLKSRTELVRYAVRQGWLSET